MLNQPGSSGEASRAPEKVRMDSCQGSYGGGKPSSGSSREWIFASHLDTRRRGRTFSRRLPEQASSSSMNGGYEVLAKLSRSTDLQRMRRAVSFSIRTTAPPQRGQSQAHDAAAQTDRYVSGAGRTAYAQDTWKASRRLTLTYGLRWDVNPSPRVSAGQVVIGTAGANPNDISTAALVPSGKPFYPTSWSNFAPRLGIAWQMLDSPKRKTVLRVGAGQFFDLGQTSVEGDGFATNAVFSSYVNQPLGSFTGGTLTSSEESPSLSLSLPLPGVFVSRGYKLPYTWEWNATLEQSLGQQTFSVGYLGALGRRLVGWTQIYSGSGAEYVVLNNDTSSSYHALQLQFNRRLSTRLHLLVSYTWSHSIDDLSNGQPYLTSPPYPSYAEPRAWGSSDFDIRQSLNGSVIAALPSLHKGAAAVLFRNWTANSIFFARTALPTDLYIGSPFVRPDLVPGEPLYLYGSEYPGGKSFNIAAFAAPTGAQGDLGRNVMRGLGAWQIDFALHREFALSDRFTLQLRAEVFNLLNHPNFANPSDTDSPGVLTVEPIPQWGAATQTLANGLSPSAVVGQLSPLFQIGGPRTTQFALRLHF
jgi:hypothetical protein